MSLLPFWDIYHLGSICSTCYMEYKSIKQIRRENLKCVIDDKFHGERKALASLFETQPSFISRLLSKKEATQKKIGDELARKIEQLSGMPINWLDNLHTDDEFVNAFSQLNERNQGKVIGQMQTLLEQQKKDNENTERGMEVLSFRGRIPPPGEEPSSTIRSKHGK